MKNPILDYFHMHQTGDRAPTTTHAVTDVWERAICGRPVTDQSELQSLRNAGGTVTCKTCSKILKARNVIDTYVGPTWFFTGDSFVSDEVILNHFGWTPPDRSFEHFFARGHLRPGRLLEVARQLTNNDLMGFEEHQTSIYECWVASTEFSKYDPEPEHTKCLITGTAEVDGGYFEVRMARQIEITVLRHEAWPLIAPSQAREEREIEFDVRRLCDWYRGARGLGRPTTPHDIEINHLPGYTVTGIPAGETDKVCLAWPTADFEEAMACIDRHAASGATKLAISGGGATASFAKLNNGVASHIRMGIRKYGPDLSMLGYLERDPSDDSWD